MHPSGVQFGLSRGLLQLRGEEVLLSDQLLEAISLEAQLHLHLGRPPIQGNFLVDITVRAAQNALGNDQGARRQEIVPFFVGLNRTMYYTLCRVAERAGLAHKEPRRLITDPISRTNSVIARSTSKSSPARASRNSRNRSSRCATRSLRNATRNTIRTTPGTQI